MKTLLLENTVKNGILLIGLLLAYPHIQTSLAVVRVESVGNLLVTVSIIAVTACFGIFAFTYERVRIDRLVVRLVAHSAVGVLMFVLGISLAMAAILSQKLVGDFPLLTLCWILLYIGTVLYDYWDLLRLDLE